MLRLFLLCLLLMANACTPPSPPLQLDQNCQADFNREALVGEHWLLQPATWRIRQSALLEIGLKKIPLEGFLRLDLRSREARLLAMNEMGVVLFDLQVTPEQEQLHSVLPQLQKSRGLAQGVAQSLRQMFLWPQPLRDDRLVHDGNSQRLLRTIDGGELVFLFDCQGDLRETRQVTSTTDWRVLYEHYQALGSVRLPNEIVLNDNRHKVKLTVWLREAKQEP